VNPTDFIFDQTGRLLFTDIESGKVFAMTNATPIELFSLSMPLGIAVDALDRIIVSSRADSVLRLYRADGAPENLALALAQPNTPLVRGPGGFWGTEVYFVSTNGNLQCVATNGTIRTVGAGFGGLEDLAFGPDGALYASHFENDLIWRIAPQGPAVPTLVLTAEGNGYRASWHGLAGLTYQPQTSTTLSGWENYGAAIPGSESPASFTFTITADPARFFRLKVIDE
jgi:hypothetical protein